MGDSYLAKIEKASTCRASKITKSLLRYESYDISTFRDR